MKNLFDFIKEVFTEWKNENSMRHSAALSFYTIFSLQPLLVVIISIAAFFFGENLTKEYFINQAKEIIGSNGAVAISTVLENASNSHSGLIASIIGIILLLIGASGVFEQLQTSLNEIWGVKPKDDVGIWFIIKNRLISLSMVLVIGFLLIVSFVLTFILNSMETYLTDLFNSEMLIPILKIGNILISFSIFTGLFGMIYKILPDAEIKWKDVFLGAVVTSFLLTIGKFAIGIYLGRSDIGSAYGAASSIIITLIWIYYASMIFFFGAEFTEVYSRKYGSKILPSEYAVYTNKYKNINEIRNRNSYIEKRNSIIENNIENIGINIPLKEDKAPKKKISIVAILFKIIFHYFKSGNNRRRKTIDIENYNSKQ